MLSKPTTKDARTPIQKSLFPPPKSSRAGSRFDPEAFLATVGVGRELLKLAKKEPLFTQGEPANTVFYIQRGKVKLTVVNERGKEAT
ncbi:MAG TPA: cyclic nucleotide-binding domain-containing protein, partial [Terriglobales bacterium]|nr:cyclic nucleotide-binding domain-containing protein [Terriglobales bacterium]